MKQHIITACLALGFALVGGQVFAQDEKFDIVRFEIRGNTLLPPGQAEALVSPFIGKARVYGDIQKALEALENAYRAKGYGTVNVHVPEQEITGGVIRLDVTEATLGKIAISGNTHFDEANIRASLPNLREGTTPNLRQISENVQLINENPAKQVEVTLGTSEEEGKVDAKVALTEEDPQRYFITLDNTGTLQTGKHRLGFAYQNANLLGNDEMLTLAYTTSPDIWFGHPNHDVKVDVYSVAFRKPFYSIGDSLDVIYGNSNINVPSSSPTLGGALDIIGKGEILALRWNHLFPRNGEYTSRLVLGYDYKHINSTCDPDGRGTVATCTPYTLQPISATYNGQWQGIGYQAKYNVGLAYNLIPSGKRYNVLGGPAAGNNDRYSLIADRTVSDDFTILRFGGSYARLVDGWQLRAALNGQLAGSALPSAEQFGLVGSTAIRGFSERAISADTGHVVNLEAYTPNLASHFGAPGNLHGVVFYDFGYGRNIGADETPFDKISVGSAGIGMRYSLGKNLSFTWDAAQIVDPGDVTIEERGDWRSHFRLTIGF